MGLAQLFETRLGVGLLADIRMILAGQLAVSTLDLILSRVTRDPHDLVIVLEFHLSRFPAKNYVIPARHSGEE